MPSHFCKSCNFSHSSVLVSVSTLFFFVWGLALPFVVSLLAVLREIESTTAIAGWIQQMDVDLLVASFYTVQKFIWDQVVHLSGCILRLSLGIQKNEQRGQYGIRFHDSRGPVRNSVGGSGHLSVLFVVLESNGASFSWISNTLKIHLYIYTFIRLLKTKFLLKLRKTLMIIL